MEFTTDPEIALGLLGIAIGIIALFVSFLGLFLGARSEKHLTRRIESFTQVNNNQSGQIDALIEQSSGAMGSMGEVMKKMADIVAKLVPGGGEQC